MKLHWLLLLCLPATAQKLQMAALSTPPAAVVHLEVQWEAPAGKEPVALQWEMLLPVKEFALAQEGPRISAAAKSAGKQLWCVGQWDKAPERYFYRCILAGGNQPVPAGTVAEVEATAPAHPGSYKAQIRRALWLAANQAKADLKNTETELRVQPPVH